MTNVEDAVFDYQPGWIPASDVTADVEFRNEGMHIHATAANVGGLRVSGRDRGYPRPQGHASAHQGGGARRGAGWPGATSSNSPLAPALGETFARLSGRGPVNAAVDLDLPIRNLDKRKIEVQAGFTDATVAMRDIDAPVRSCKAI